MSMFSTATSYAGGGEAVTVARNGYRFTTSTSIGAMPALSMAAMWSADSRSASRPPCTAGCSVLTRPSSISGNPVTESTGVTATPAAARAAAEPPVDRIS